MRDEEEKATTIVELRPSKADASVAVAREPSPAARRTFAIVLAGVSVSVFLFVIGLVMILHANAGHHVVGRL